MFCNISSLPTISGRELAVCPEISTETTHCHCVHNFTVIEVRLLNSDLTKPTRTVADVTAKLETLLFLIFIFVSIN